MQQGLELTEFPLYVSDFADPAGLKATEEQGKAVAEAERLALQVSREFPRAVFFAGKLIFQEERFYQRALHNETAYSLQRRLQFAGLNAMVLPVRVTLSATG